MGVPLGCKRLVPGETDVARHHHYGFVGLGSDACHGGNDRCDQRQVAETRDLAGDPAQRARLAEMTKILDERYRD